MRKGFNVQQFAEEDEIRAPLEYGWGGKRVMGGSELGGGGGGGVEGWEGRETKKSRIALR